jgi:hypothetical protein
VSRFSGVDTVLGKTSGTGLDYMKYA